MSASRSPWWLVTGSALLGLVAAPQQAHAAPAGLAGYAHSVGGAADGIDVQGDYAYVADWGSPSGLNVFDVSDPDAPLRVWSGNGGYSNEAADVRVLGHYAYVANDGDCLLVYDIAVPTSPQLVGHGSCGEYAHAIWVENINGRVWAFVSGPYSTSIQAFDVTDVTAIEGPFRWSPPDGATETPQVYVTGYRAYVMAYGGSAVGYTFKILDVSNPRSMQWISAPLPLPYSSTGGPAGFGSRTTTPTSPSTAPPTTAA